MPLSIEPPEVGARRAVRGSLLYPVVVPPGRGRPPFLEAAPGVEVPVTRDVLPLLTKVGLARVTQASSLP